MPNHVHLIVVPQDEDGLRRALARVHRRYAGLIHARRRRTGHFWQGRYGAVAMDEDHLAAAYRTVNLNPVRPSGRAGRRLAVVERARPSEPRRGPPYRGVDALPWSKTPSRAKGSRRNLEDLVWSAVAGLAPARQRFSRFADLLKSPRGRRGDGAPAQRRERRPAARLGHIPRRAGNQDTPPPPRPQAGAQAKGRRSDRGREVKCTVTGTAPRRADLTPTHSPAGNGLSRRRGCASAQAAALPLSSDAALPLSSDTVAVGAIKLGTAGEGDDALRRDDPGSSTSSTFGRLAASMTLTSSAACSARSERG